MKPAPILVLLAVFFSSMQARAVTVAVSGVVAINDTRANPYRAAGFRRDVPRPTGSRFPIPIGAGRLPDATVRVEVVTKTTKGVFTTTTVTTQCDSSGRYSASVVAGGTTDIVVESVVSVLPEVHRSGSTDFVNR